MSAKTFWRVTVFLILAMRLPAQYTDPNKPYNEIVKEREEYFKKQADLHGQAILEGEGSEYAEFQRWKRFWEPRIGLNRTMNDYYLERNTEAEKSKNGAPAYSGKISSVGNTDAWWELGPYNKPSSGLTTIGGGDLGTGVVHDMVISTYNANNMLAWSLAGGLYYTTNKGNQWYNAGSDKWTGSGCSSADFCSYNDNMWYAASNIGGMYTNNIIGSFGGVLRTTNTGATWDLIGDASSFNGDWAMTINKIKVDPNIYTNIVYVASSHGLWKNNNANAVLPGVKSNWALESVTTANDLVRDIEFRTDWGGDFFISKATPIPNTNPQAYSWTIEGNHQGNWSTLQNSPFSPSSIIELDIEVSDAAPNYLFIRTSDASNVNLYKCDISNLNNPQWTLLSTNGTQIGGPGFCVSNFNANIIYLGNFIGFKKSTDGGYTWPGGLITNDPSSNKYFHSDVDKLITPPSTCLACSTDVFLGTHGGVSFSSDAANTIQVKNNGLGLARGSLATSATNPEKIIMGLDHDGSVISDGVFSQNWNPTWYTIGDGDGSWPMIDYSDPNYVWASHCGHIPYVSSQGGLIPGSYANINIPQSNSWSQVIFQNKTYPNIVYYPGSNNNSPYYYEEVWRSNTRGIAGSPERISNFASLPWPDNIARSQYMRGDIYPTSDPNIMYAAISTNDGLQKFFKNNTVLSDPATVIANWQYIPFPNSQVHNYLGKSIYIDPENPNIVYMTYKDYYYSPLELYKVDYTNVASPTFIDISGCQNSNNSMRLPSVTITGIIKEMGSNGGIYVATDVGIYYSNNYMLDFVHQGSSNNSQWIKLGTNLPNLPTQGIDINYNVNKLRVSTMGRGVWEHDLFCPSSGNLNLSGAQNSDYFYEAVNQIVSTQQIGSSANVTYRGGTYVDLNPGFITTPISGETTLAFIHPCSYSGNSPNLLKGADASETESISDPNVAVRIKNEELKIYPNPTKDKIFIDFSELEEFPQTINICNLLGEVVKIVHEVDEKEIAIDLKEYNDGMYIVNINFSNKTISRKIVKTGGRN